MVRLACLRGYLKSVFTHEDVGQSDVRQIPNDDNGLTIVFCNDHESALTRHFCAIDRIGHEHIPSESPSPWSSRTSTDLCAGDQ
jgi:hypothetical protein